MRKEVKNMRKEVKEWGNSLVITFNSEERRMIGIKRGDVLDLTINDIETREPNES